MQVTEKQATGNQTIGRGKLYLGSNALEAKHLGNTPNLSFAIGHNDVPNAKIKIWFSIDNMTFENHKLWLEGYEGDLFYKACNPCGPNVDYRFKGVNVSRSSQPFAIKSEDNWQTLHFSGEADVMEIQWPCGRRFLIEATS